MNKFQEALEARLAHRLQEKRVVVWYDTDREFVDFIAALKRLPSDQDGHENLKVGGVVARLAISSGSLFGLKLKVESLVSGDKPEPLLLYLPGMSHSRLGSPLMELEKAGDLLLPQKISLERLAREELSALYTQGQIDEMLATTSLTYLDVVGLFKQQKDGGSASLLKLVLGEGSSSELLATWLASDTYDSDLSSKGAAPELFKLVAAYLGLQIDPAVDLGKARRHVCRYVLVNEFRSDLTGKSYAVQELSPYASLLTGPTTVANLFGHMNGKQKGMVMIWDVVGFDEVADLQKMPKEVITTLKTYCESGQFQRGQEAMAGYASMAMFGNTQQPIDVMVQNSHLFAPLPDVIRDDMAFIDRLHFYLPGWEIPKMHNDHFTSHYGFVVDYLAEAFRELRKHNYTEIIDRHFSLGAHLNARDRKAVRRTVSGLVKVLHPHGEVSKTDLEEILNLAVEGRRRVKEQLKKMGSFEYHQTHFSYQDNETGQETFVGVPEQGGRDLIAADPLPPGTLYAASVSGDGTVGLYRLEVSVSGGTGKLKSAGGISGEMKESIQRSFNYLKANKTAFGIAREIDTSDVHVEAIDLLGNHVVAEVGVAFAVALVSAFKKAAPLPALLVLGDLSIQGNIKSVRSLTEPLQVAMDNGARRVLIPIENKRSFFDVSADVLENVDPIFYGEVRQAAFKALGLT